MACTFPHVPTQATERMGMTPMAVVLLMEFYYSGCDVELGPPARVQAFYDFVHRGLVKAEYGAAAAGPRGSRYVPPGCLTDRGRAHVDAICALPLPVSRTVWETPQKEGG